MTDWKAIGIGAIINAVLTMVLTLIMFPLFFLGPVIGGFITTYLANDNLSYYGGNPTDGAVEGAISGVIGGLIIGIIFILGFGAISAIIGLVFTEIGLIAGTIISNNWNVYHFNICDHWWSFRGYWWSYRSFSKRKGIGKG